MKSGAKDDDFNDTTTAIDGVVIPTAFGNFNPLNDWNTDSTENVDTASFGVIFQLIPEKLTLNTSYNFSYSEMHVIGA